jgi:hypothetical protein
MQKLERQAISLPRMAAPQTVSIGRIRWPRIALSVSEGTLSPEPHPLADAQGYPEYLLENRRGAQERNGQ